MKKTLRCSLMMAMAGLVLTMAGCSSDSKMVDVTGPIRDSLKQAGLKDVTVDQDKDKGVVTLGGHVESDSEKGQAESIAKGVAGTQVVANQVAVLPPGGEHTAKEINSDLDKAIDHNLAAALLEAEPKDNMKNVKYEVKNGVVTLTGKVTSQRRRTDAQNIAASVPNVQQVVNKLEVKDQKATSTP